MSDWMREATAMSIVVGLLVGIPFAALTPLPWWTPIVAISGLIAMCSVMPAISWIIDRLEEWMP